LRKQNDRLSAGPYENETNCAATKGLETTKKGGSWYSTSNQELTDSFQEKWRMDHLELSTCRPENCEERKTNRCASKDLVSNRGRNIDVTNFTWRKTHGRTNDALWRRIDQYQSGSRLTTATTH
jgi:hypothetical protein